MFRYAVAELETLSGNDLEGLDSGEWNLTLFTHPRQNDPGGSALCVCAGVNGIISVWTMDLAMQSQYTENFFRGCLFTLNKRDGQRWRTAFIWSE